MWKRSSRVQAHVATPTHVVPIPTVFAHLRARNNLKCLLTPLPIIIANHYFIIGSVTKRRRVDELSLIAGKGVSVGVHYNYVDYKIQPSCRI